MLNICAYYLMSMSLFTVSSSLQKLAFLDHIIKILLATYDNESWEIVPYVFLLKIVLKFVLMHTGTVNN